MRVVEIRGNLSVESHEGSSTVEKAGGQEEKEPKKVIHCPTGLCRESSMTVT